MYETDIWPMIKASHFTPVTAGRRRVRVIVIHDMEYPEKGTSAEEIARYFAAPSTQVSAHICVDNDSIVQCVKDNDVAWAAPGCNNDGIQVELAGYANQKRGQWLDQYGIELMRQAGDAVAQYCLKYNIPPVQLTNAQLHDGQKGIVGHRQVSQVYKRSDHMDPGVNFPWDIFLAQVRAQIEDRIS